MPNAPIQENNELTLFAWGDADISHQNVFLFNSVQGQTKEQVRDAYFAPIAPGTNGAFPDAAILRAYNYSFVSGNKVRVPYLITEVQGFNYLRYMNTNAAGTFVGSGLHRIYAFITDMKYINNSTTEITFEVDYWTTYQPFITFKSGYVERTHVPKVSDTIGNWLAPEPFQADLTVTRTEGFDYVTSNQPKKLYILASAIPDSEHAQQLESATFEFSYITDPNYPFYPEGHGPYNHRAFSGLAKLGFTICDDPNDTAGIERMMQNVEAMNRYLRDYPTFVDAIIQVYYGYEVPVDMSEFDRNLPDRYTTYIAIPDQFDFGNHHYDPKNKKLFTYPYVCAEASTPQTKKDYAFELSLITHDFPTTDPAVWVNKKAIAFKHAANSDTQFEILAVPEYYAGQQYDFDNAIRLADFPQVSCASDAYQQYINQNGTKNLLSYIGGVLAVGGGIAATVASAGSAAPAALPIIAGGATTLGGISTIANTAESERLAKQLPGNAHGTSSPNVLWNANEYRIKFRNKTILPEQAEIIDDYLTRYGYAFNRIASSTEINSYMNSRSLFNYIKTKNYHVKGEYFVPAQARRYIEALFDRGVTLWHDFNYIGVYDHGENN